jgi:hypothetical protein
VKRTGLALMMATLAPGAFASGSYTEVWNPPEARATAPRHVRVALKPVSHRHMALHTVKLHARRQPSTTPNLMATRRHVEEAAPVSEPDMSNIPRQITPEGNVLRVTTRGATVEVSR